MQPRPAQDRTNARQQFPRNEGFADIIVASHLEADDAVHVVGACRQDDDRQRAARAQIPTERQTVFAGHHDVEDHEIDREAREHAARLVGAGGDTHLEILPSERRRQRLADLGSVVDNEQAGFFLRFVDHAARVPVAGFSHGARAKAKRVGCAAPVRPWPNSGTSASTLSEPHRRGRKSVRINH